MERIDLVYLWVDGSDPEWLQQKQRALAESGREYSAQAVAKGRFVQCDELKYSLRSVEKYAPWVDRIFILTADQRPEWLNMEHPKIRLISHRDFIPAEYLPTFNSSAIEMCISEIEELGERFILANDDMFLLRPVDPSFFYTSKGLPVARMSPSIVKGTDLYSNKVLRAQRLVAERYGHSCVRMPHHNMDAYLKEDVKACEEQFRQEVEATRSHTFRTEGEFHRSAWLYAALATGRAEERVVGHYGASRGWWEAWKCRLAGRYCMESKVVGIHRGDLARRVRKYNPTILCLNDTEHATDSQRQQMKALLERLFPEKSSFEK
jgi:hypothetical protein